MLRMFQFRAASRLGGTTTRAYSAASGAVANAAPIMDMIDVNDNPALGFMVRVVYTNRCVEVSHYPQLGPRKTDPMDPMPQFDFQKRVFIRFNKGFVSEMIAVADNKIPETVMKTAYGATAA